MSDYTIITEEFEELTIDISHDPDAGNPYLEWDQASRIVTWHDRYSFSNDKMSDFGIHGSRSGGFYTYRDDGSEKYFNTGEEIGEFLRKDGSEVMPLYLYDHGGLSISTADFGDRWDSGMVGFVIMEPTAIKREISQYNRKGGPLKSRVANGEVNGKTEYWMEYFVGGIWKREKAAMRRFNITKGDREKARTLMVGEIESLDQYLTGQVYQYRVTDEEGNYLDGCGGYFGEIEYVLEEARSSAEFLWKEIVEKREAEAQELRDLESEVDEMRQIETGEAA